MCNNNEQNTYTSTLFPFFKYDLLHSIHFFLPVHSEYELERLFTAPILKAFGFFSLSLSDKAVADGFVVTPVVVEEEERGGNI